jgi:hypothetical protein
MGGKEDPEPRSPEQQLGALLAGLKAAKEAREGETLQLKQLAAAVHRQMRADKTGHLSAGRDRPYSVSHLHGVLNSEKPSRPSPALAGHLASVLGGNEFQVREAVQLATRMRNKPRPPRAAGPRAAAPPLAAAADAIWQHLRGQKRPGEPGPGRYARMAVEIALSSAVAQFAMADGKAALALPLLRPDGFLTRSEVARELAEVMRSGDLGFAGVFGQRWSEAMLAAAGGRDLTEDARELLGYLRAEARSLAPLRALVPAGQAAAPDSPPRTSLDVAVGPQEQLSRLREDLAGLAAAASRGIGDATRDLPPRIRVQLYDQTGLILRSSKGFVGRDFVFTQLRDFVGRARSGYCFVQAHPGVGKTALLAHLLMNEPGYIRHFNVLTDNVTTPEAFLKNVCAQLIGAYRLPYEELPDRAAYDNNFLTELLERSVTAKRDSKVVVVIDALDEVQTRGQLPGTNPLYLPRALPDGCLFIVTVRKDAPGCRPLLDPECAPTDVSIDERSQANMDDIREFVRVRTAWPGIRTYMGAHGFDADQFIGHMADKSEGNFMYLHHVLPQIEAGGYLADRDIEQLPAGLTAYYSDQLKRMKAADDEAWFSWKLPVITVLANAEAPLTIREIAERAHVRQRARVVALLREWLQFLDVAPATRDGHPYRIFHASFKEFLLDEVSGGESELELMDRLHREANRHFVGDE